MKVKIYKLTLILCLFFSFPTQAQQEFEWQVEPTLEYNIASDFHEGLARVMRDALPHEKPKNTMEGEASMYGFIDKNGKLAIPFKYNSAYDFKDGIAFVKIKRKGNFINKKGKLIVPRFYDCLSFSLGGTIIIISGKKYGLMSKQGKVIVPPKYDEVDYYSNNLLSVRINYKWSFVDRKGKEVIPHDSITRTQKQNTKLLYSILKKNEKYALIYKEKNITPFKYDWIFNFLYEPLFSHKYFLLKVVLNGKHGYINKNGKEIIKPQFEQAYNFSEGLACVKLNGKWGIIKNPLLSPPTTYAFMVGIEDYQANSLEDLQSTERAVYEFRNLLTAGLRLPIKNVTALTNSQASKNAILDSLRSKVGKVNTQDVLIFYFTGHGDAEKHTSDKYGLYAYDSRKSRPQSLLKYTEIFEIMQSSDAKHKIIIIDACGSGAVTMNYEDDIKAQSEYQSLIQELDKSFIIITSTKAGQEAYDDGNFPDFTRFLLEGLKGKAGDSRIITVRQAFDYAKIKTEKFMEGDQNPQIMVKEGYDDKLPFIVVPK